MCGVKQATMANEGEESHWGMKVSLLELVPPTSTLIPVRHKAHDHSDMCSM